MGLEDQVAEAGTIRNGAVRADAPRGSRTTGAAKRLVIEKEAARNRRSRGDAAANAAGARGTRTAAAADGLVADERHVGEGRACEPRPQDAASCGRTSDTGGRVTAPMAWLPLKLLLVTVSE